MKNVLIWGVPRSGKSTLAKMIRNEYGHGIIYLDGIKSVYDVVRPEDRISAPETTNFDEAKMMAKMVTRLIKCLSWCNDHGEYHVYEGVGFDFESILPALPEDKFPTPLEKFIVLCIGYSEISTEGKVEEVNKYETERDWTYGKSMVEKLEWFQTYCDESKYVKETAQRLGLRYFDVSFQRDEVLKEIMGYIKQSM